jgi:hypothetical protein
MGKIAWFKQFDINNSKSPQDQWDEFCIESSQIFRNQILNKIKNEYPKHINDSKWIEEFIKETIAYDENIFSFREDCDINQLIPLKWVFFIQILII